VNTAIAVQFVSTKSSAAGEGKSLTKPGTRTTVLLSKWTWTTLVTAGKDRHLFYELTCLNPHAVKTGSNSPVDQRKSGIELRPLCYEIPDRS